MLKMQVGYQRVKLKLHILHLKTPKCSIQKNAPSNSHFIFKSILQRNEHAERRSKDKLIAVLLFSL